MSKPIAIAGAVLLALILLFSAYMFRYRDAEDASVCRTRYHQARTSGDTAAIDAQLAPRSRGRGEQFSNLTCGELRRLGRTE